MIDLKALPIDKWSTEDLFGMFRERTEAIEPLSADVETIVTELKKRCADNISAAYKKADKTHGKVTIKSASFGTDMPVEVDAEVRQTVEWNQDKLKAVFSDHPNEASDVIEAKLSVPENTYKALPRGDLKTALTAARTTKLSKPSLKIRFTEES